MPLLPGGLPRLIGKAASTLATGVVGVVAVRALEGSEPGSLVRRSAVRATTLGIRGARRAEVVVERTRLAAGDIRARAYADLGETVPPPTGPESGAAADHQH